MFKPKYHSLEQTQTTIPKESKDEKPKVPHVRHQLGYYLDAPLPYFLTDEELFPTFKLNENCWTEETSDTVIETEKILADFLNSGHQYSEEPVAKANTIPQLDEYAFVRGYLVYLAYAPKPGEENHAINKWLDEVAGNHYNPVEILREGKPIFRVPPALSRINTHNWHKEDGVTLTAMATQVSYEIDRFPPSANSRTSALLEKMYTTEGINGVTTRNNIELKYLFTMDEIFTYYGYPSILTPEIMQFKAQVLGAEHVDPSRPIQPTTATKAVDATFDDNDDDLW